MKTASTYLGMPLMATVLISLGISSQAQKPRRYQQARYYPAVQRYYTSIPGPYMSINYAGDPYYYSAGVFYRPHNGYYNVVAPPYGIRVNVLPPAYYPITMGGNPYYYSQGVFYRSSPREQDYEVVQAPVGAEVPSLPAEAKTMMIDGEKYYSLNGTYFKDASKPNGELWYKVVGKNGVLNTYKNTAGNYQQPQNYPQQQPVQQTQVAPQQQQAYPQQSMPQPAPQQQVPSVQQQVYVFAPPQVMQQQNAPQQQAYPQQQSTPQQQTAPQSQQVFPQQQNGVQQQQSYPQQQPASQQELPMQQVQPQAPAGQPQSVVPQSQSSNENQGWPTNGGVREAIRRGSPAAPATTATIGADSVRKQQQQLEDEEYDELGESEYTAPPIITHDNPGLGWVVDKLPQDCKAVTISGKKYFVAPNNTYYQEWVDDKRQIRYKVVSVNR
jgi:hypothetical protein